MKTLRQRVKELEEENKKLNKRIDALVRRCDNTEYKANHAVLSVAKVDEIEERIEILEIIQKENQRDVLNLLAKDKKC